MQNEKSHSSSARRHLPAGVDEYLEREGLTDEEWERIYDLRYCTILVPKKNDGNTTSPDQEDTCLPTPEEQQPDYGTQHQQQAEPLQSPETLVLAEVEQLSTPTTPPPTSVLTKHRSNSTVLPPTPTMPNPKRRRLIDPSLEIDNDTSPAFIGDDSSDDDATGHEQGQSELGGVSEDEGPMSSNDPMFGFLRQPRRSSRRESISTTTPTTATTKKPSSTRSFFSKFWRSNSPDVEHNNQIESDMEPPQDKVATVTTTEVVITHTTTTTCNPSEAMEIDQSDNGDQDMLAEPQLSMDAVPETSLLQVPQDGTDTAQSSKDGSEFNDDKVKCKGGKAADSIPELNDTNKPSGTGASHWPIPSPTHHLLRERRPRANTDFSHLAWMSSPSLGGRSPTSSHSLLKPRSFTPPLVASIHPAFGQREPFSIPEQPGLLRKAATTRSRTSSRRGSFSSDMSSTSFTSLLSHVPLTTSLSSQRATSSSDDWTNYHWNHLEVLYMQMNGDTLPEGNLYSIVDKFLEEDAQQSGQPNRWSRNMIRRRCVALHRIRHSDKRRGTISTRPWEQKQQQTTKNPSQEYTQGEGGRTEDGKESSFSLAAKRLPLTPFTPLAGPKSVPTPNPEALRELLHPKGSTASSTLVHRRRARESARPYPSTPTLQRATSSTSEAGPLVATSIQPATSSSLSCSGSTKTVSLGHGAHGGGQEQHLTSMASLQRQERRKKMKLSQDIYTQKSVFKHRLAEGLQSVKQLLPFWREVENGQGTIKEQIAVPLVPQRKVKRVVDAFETAMDEALSTEDGVGSVSGCGGGGDSKMSHHRRRMSSVSMASSSRRSSASGVSESVAEMIARGHAARMLSSAASMSSGSNGSSDTLVTPAASSGSTEL